jgi:hypothetical protein
MLHFEKVKVRIENLEEIAVLSIMVYMYVLGHWKDILLALKCYLCVRA